MFGVGDVCTIVGLVRFPDFNGKDCVVRGQSEPPWLSIDVDGEFWEIRPENLRKKPPYDGNTKITWDDMPYWKPKELVRV